ncbi:hypothetical protein OCU04_007381 [Sclerotinia nivalis]|uniref:BTB domain-containing protein n=1 Tax=Sclerotinia nivalis TaxID=352851 RepID=A0A9X0AIX3_9HELO|nr:hypothetical protein OCU04_007381 [Sclerotinia nivalis]
MNNNLNNGQINPFPPVTFPKFPSSPGWGQYGGGFNTGGSVQTTVDPFRSYSHVVRDFLSGNLPASPPPPVCRAFSSQYRAANPRFTDMLGTPPAQPILDTVSAGDTSNHEAIRRLTRLELKAADRRPAPTWNNVSMDMVTIYIKGENGSVDGPPFNLHKSFFTDLSPYFEAVFNSGFAESETQTLHFAESNREIFAMLVDWVYKKDLKALAAFELDDRKNLPVGIGLSTLQGNDLEEYIKKSQETALEHTTKLIDLWFLADKVLIPELQNAALQAIEILRFFTPLQGVPAEISHAVYDKTPKRSPLRLYLAITTLRRLHPNSEDHGEDFHPDMLVDIFNLVKVIGADAKLRHYGLSEMAMESYLVATKGGSHLKSNPIVTAPLAGDIWVSLWELRRDALNF